MPNRAQMEPEATCFVKLGGYYGLLALRGSRFLANTPAELAIGVDSANVLNSLKFHRDSLGAVINRQTAEKVAVAYRLNCRKAWRTKAAVSAASPRRRRAPSIASAAWPRA